MKWVANRGTKRKWPQNLLFYRQRKRKWYPNTCNMRAWTGWNGILHMCPVEMNDTQHSVAMRINDSKSNTKWCTRCVTTVWWCENQKTKKLPSASKATSELRGPHRPDLTGVGDKPRGDKRSRSYSLSKSSGDSAVVGANEAARASRGGTLSARKLLGEIGGTLVARHGLGEPTKNEIKNGKSFLFALKLLTTFFFLKFICDSMNRWWETIELEYMSFHWLIRSVKDRGVYNVSINVWANSKGFFCHSKDGFPGEMVKSHWVLVETTDDWWSLHRGRPCPAHGKPISKRIWWIVLCNSNLLTTGISPKIALHSHGINGRTGDEFQIDVQHYLSAYDSQTAQALSSNASVIVQLSFW